MSLTRREWLRSAVGTPALLAFSPWVPSLLTRASFAAARADGDNAIVVVQLSGGNDGLNTVVPYADDAYGRQRRTLRLTEREVLKIGDDLGLHADMRAFWQLHQDGKAAIVQGVGYPNNDRGHDEALRDWHTARPAEAACPTGWLGRAIDVANAAGPPTTPGVFVGPIPTPFALNAARSVVPAIRSLTAENLPMLDRLRRESQSWRQVNGPAVRDTIAPARRNALADFVQANMEAGYVGSERLGDVLRQAPSAAYPPFQLAEQLRAVAVLLRANLGIRIFFVELGGGGIGGFDNHANQRDNHAALLKQLSESVAAFARDLQRDGALDRVVLMTFSEFGRTLTENGRRGTDHGAAQPVLMVGGRLHGGLIGKHPSLTDLDNDAPKSHTDFRRVYATLLGGWLGLDAQTVLDGSYAPLDLFA